MARKRKSGSKKAKMRVGQTKMVGKGKNRRKIKKMKNGRVKFVKK